MDMNNINKLKTEITEKIEELKNELNNINELNNYKEDDIQVGDYFIYDEKDEKDKKYYKIAQISVDQEDMYQIYYPQFKEIYYCNYSSIEEIYKDWMDFDKYVKYIPIKNDRVHFLEIDKEYFLLNEHENKWHIATIALKNDKIVAYDKNDNIIGEGNNINELFINLLDSYTWISEVRNNNVGDKYSLLSDKDFLTDLTSSILRPYKEIYKYIKFDNYQLIDAGEQIARYSGLSKEELKKIVNKENIDEKLWYDKSSIILKTLNSYIKTTKEYFLDDKTGKWYPNDLNLSVGDNISYSNDYIYEIVKVNDKYGLYNEDTSELNPEIYESIKEIVDDICDSDYEEVMNI